MGEFGETVESAPQWTHPRAEGAGVFVYLFHHHHHHHRLKVAPWGLSTGLIIF